MPASTTLTLIAAAALLLALGGCDTTDVDATDGVPPVVNALALPPLGQGNFSSFESEKRNAPLAQEMAQF
jgi:hypothetical protein